MAPPKTKKAAATLRFDQRLVLNQWITSLFEVPSFDDLADRLRSADLEGYDEVNVAKFHRQLVLRLKRDLLPDDLLLTYDANIVRHWQRITSRRSDGQRLYMKYFQYLALLFTEIYLDRYFSDEDLLLDALNKQVVAFNMGKKQEDIVPFFTPDLLNKLAFWMATGSGKTLLMHCNILQYRHYLNRAGRDRELNRIILLTPNEGLSRQHLDEFDKSGLQAEIFQKEGRGLFAGESVEIIDINKLREDQGQKTVAIDAFEGNNLVLVDEGHRGAGGDVWMATRNRLCEDGFSFEYSATFGQAMKAANKKGLSDEYARCILFDYSYRYFYRDGYGKDYRILNLAKDDNEGQRRLYLTASLLTFYQQVRLYQDDRPRLARFLLESPLWVFVGANVNAVRTDNKRQVSDVVDILLFLNEFVSNKKRSTGEIKRLLSGNTGLLDTKSRDIFANNFAYLAGLGLAPDAVFADILHLVFNAATDASLHLDDLKGVEGEIALRIGDYDAFGVINVGDTSKLLKLCEAQGLNVAAKEFATSLFQRINDAGSTVRILIGSKKFTEGWSSWRVSTMGLMHVGKSEGSEIIQLFGRGVRLKGYEFALKRSAYVSGVEKPANIGVLETLNVLGVRADYMQQFRQYLEDEGLSPDTEMEEFTLPTVALGGLAQKKLRTIRVKEGIDFKKQGPKPALAPIEDLKRHPITVDWYPRLQSAVSRGIATEADKAAKQEGKLTAHHLAYMDFDTIWLELYHFKNERAWYNFDLPRDAPRELLSKPDWYHLYIPEDELAFRAFDRFRRWQEIAVALLVKYCDRLYKHCKNAFEYDKLEYVELTPTDPNFVDEYKVLVAQSEVAVIAELRKLKDEIDVGNLRVFRFDQHLYNPLVYARGGMIDVKPVALNEGERDFVLGLRTFCEKNRSFLKDNELYLLRNRSRSGIGFFEAGNFYPDFMLWLIAGGKQHVTFVDPKGIRNLDGPEDPKIRFSSTIKDLEKKLGDPTVVLNSYILSVTPYAHGGWWTNSLTKGELEARNVLFMEDGVQEAIGAILGVRITPRG